MGGREGGLGGGVAGPQLDWAKVRGCELAPNQLYRARGYGLPQNQLCRGKGAWPGPDLCMGGGLLSGSDPPCGTWDFVTGEGWQY